MPHILIEFSAGQAGQAQVETLLDAVHDALAATGLFETGHIRLRAIPLHHYRCAGARTPFIHAQLRIHSGRGSDEKRRASAAVLAALRAQQWPAEVITVEVVEMERESYAKYSRE